MYELLISEKVDEKHNLLGGEFVPTHAPSSYHNRIGSNFDSYDFECQDHTRHQKHAGKLKLKVIVVDERSEETTLYSGANHPPPTI